MVREKSRSESGAKLGSTAHAMVYHAKCPVLVVPATD
ncbi:universal stress protein [Antrihabitans stalactiti]